MRRNDVYLEAANRTQELLNIKWSLRAAGYSLGSTWHDDDAAAGLASKDHWNARSLEQLRACNSLVVICDKNGAAPELAMMAGLALARDLQVIWIGSAIRGLSAFRSVRYFNRAEDYRKEILQQKYSRPGSAAEKLAA
jgi:hypothetical protein